MMADKKVVASAIQPVEANPPISAAKDSGMVVCGPHVIRAASVALLKQVRSKVATTELLFIVVVAGYNEAIFLDTYTVKPLLDYWGIDIELLESLGDRPALAKSGSSRTPPRGPYTGPPSDDDLPW